MDVTICSAYDSIRYTILGLRLHQDICKNMKTQMTDFPNITFFSNIYYFVKDLTTFKV